jgi:hypothetical protein
MLGLSGFGFTIFNFVIRENGIQILPPPGNHYFNSFHLYDIGSDSENHADAPLLSVQIRSD